MERRTKIILIVVLLILICFILALAFGLLLPASQTIKLEVWPRGDDNSDSPLIVFNANDASSVVAWTSRTSEFLKEYHRTTSLYRVPCKFTNAQNLGESQVCDVPVDDFHPCTSSNEYNYRNAGPCVFLTLNKILNWSPIPYNSTEGLPEKMPEGLKQHIRIVSGKPEANLVWVSCDGENPADEENIGPVQYIPRRGLPAYYYPFTNKEGYLSPVVAVLFERPRPGVLVNIQCKAWAKNIENDSYEQSGLVHFKLQVDH